MTSETEKAKGISKLNEETYKCSIYLRHVIILNWVSLVAALLTSFRFNRQKAHFIRS